MINKCHHEPRSSRVTVVVVIRANFGSFEGPAGTLGRNRRTLSVPRIFFACLNEKAKRSRAMTRGANLSRVTSEAGQLGNDAPHLVYDILSRCTLLEAKSST